MHSNLEHTAGEGTPPEGLLSTSGGAVSPSCPQTRPWVCNENALFQSCLSGVGRFLTLRLKRHLQTLWIQRRLPSVSELSNHCIYWEGGLGGGLGLWEITESLQLQTGNLFIFIPFLWQPAPLEWLQEWDSDPDL
ncbi:hypothetical protein CgunFtcFv8_023954 [Champsocephalus gunnari]|uniref:Uncharacterized protein n=1 Tax=Champsocephalus gunnari TaxID=52237 RepID=A0AAN8DDG8_CHAGU|nr:hypothetical protein CgunFtcFv8_023954 [Champsocephalus gunnari]